MAQSKHLDFSVIYYTSVCPYANAEYTDLELKFVKCFTDQLEIYGFNGWYYDRDAKPWSNIFDVLEHCYQSPRNVFMVFSKGFQQDKWLEYSCHSAYFTQINSGVTKIVPIQLGNQAVIPNAIRIYACNPIMLPEQFDYIQEHPEWKKVVKLMAYQTSTFPDQMDADKAIKFCIAASDYLMSRNCYEEIVEHDLKTVILVKRHKDIGGNYRWNYPEDVFPEDVFKFLFEKKKSSGKQPPTYNPKKVSDLLRAIRNSHIHKDQVPENVKQFFGNRTEDYLDFWLSKFPRLLQVTYQAMQKVLDDEDAKVLLMYYPEKMVDKYCGDHNTKKISQSSTATNDRTLTVETAIQSRQKLPEQEPTQMSSITNQEDRSFSLPPAHTVTIYERKAELTNAESDEDGITENIPNEKGDNTDYHNITAETGDSRGSSQQNPALSVPIGQQSLSLDSDLTADCSFSPNDDQRNGIPGSLPVIQGLPGNLNSPSQDSGYCHSIPETPVDNMPVIVEDTTGLVSDNEISDGLPISPTLQASDDIAEQNHLNTNAMSSHENCGGFSGLAYLKLGLGVLLLSIILYKIKSFSLK